MKMIKINKTWLVVIIIVLIIAGYFVVKNFLQKPSDAYVTEKVGKGEVLQEVSETGSVNATESLNLSFKSIGKVSKIDVAVGDSVKKGDILAELDSSQLSAQLKSAKAALSYTTNQYNSGVASAQDSLQSAYKSASNVLSDAYTKIYNAYNAVTDLQNTYFSAADQEGIRVQDSKNDMQKNMSDVKPYLDGAQTNSAIDSAIPQTLADLDNVYNDLKIIRAQCDSGAYYSSVSSTSKTFIDTQKTNINTALTNLTASQASLSSYKIALQKAEDKAASSVTGDNVSSSQVEQAQANVDLYQSQLNDTYLRSPIDGTITDVNVKKGEVVSASESIINLLSSDPFQIKVDIYEQDIVDVKPGDAATITLVAFPKQTFEGKVLSIGPGEKIIDNVVYYEVTIDFPNQPDGVRSGMTADIVIETNKKEDVLRIPKNAVENIDGKDTVQIVNNGKIENRQITAGLEGNDYVEIISGLNEGDEIVTGKK